MLIVTRDTPVIERRKKRMKVNNWICALFSIVLAGTNVTKVEAAYPAVFARGLANNFSYRRHFPFLHNIFGTELKKLLPAPTVSDNVKEIESNQVIAKMEIDQVQTSPILEDNTTLTLGVVLADKEGEIYFFMSPTRNDPVKSTLMQASVGLVDANHDIREFVLIKYTEPKMVYYLDYTKNPEVWDRFTVINEYEEYLLLRSSAHSIVFVAPKASVDGFIRIDLQKRFAKRKNKSAPQKISVINEPVVISRDLNVSKDVEYTDSPNTVTGVDALENISHIEMLFKTVEGDASLRSNFITERLAPSLKAGNISLQDAFIILKTAEKVFNADHLVEYINVDINETIVVVGDIHGQYLDLLRIFERCGWPSAQRKYLFNGDIVDRGDASIECLMLLYALKISLPKSVYINRGNHESETCGIGKFYQQSHEFDPTGIFFVAAQQGFNILPAASVINDRIYVVHAGIRAHYNIKDISVMEHLNSSNEFFDFLHVSLWDDASESEGISVNYDRGGNCRYFGPDVTESFLQLNEFDRVIRSHTFVQKGFASSHGGNVWTVFSAPNYGKMGNESAVIILNHNLEHTFERFSPVSYRKSI